MSLSAQEIYDDLTIMRARDIAAGQNPGSLKKYQIDRLDYLNDEKQQLQDKIEQYHAVLTATYEEIEGTQMFLDTLEEEVPEEVSKEAETKQWLFCEGYQLGHRAADPLNMTVTYTTLWELAKTIYKSDYEDMDQE